MRLSVIAFLALATVAFAQLPRTDVPVRLSGTFGALPAASASVGADYYATDTGVVYKSVGNSWIVRPSFSATYGYQPSGTFANIPTSSTCVGWLYYATDTGVIYEAFPTAWYNRGAGVANPIASTSGTSAGIAVSGSGAPLLLSGSNVPTYTTGIPNASVYFLQTTGTLSGIYQLTGTLGWVKH